MQYLATFLNQMQALAYAGALSRRGIPYRLMPRPRALEASCGTAVRFTSGLSVSSLRALSPVSSLYRIEGGAYLPVG